MNYRSRCDIIICEGDVVYLTLVSRDRRQTEEVRFNSYMGSSFRPVSRS